MKIANKILGILDELKSIGALKSYIYQSPGRANVEMDYEETPTAILYCITDKRVSLSSQNAKEVSSVNLFFVTRQGNVDFDGLQNDTLIDAMGEVAYGFLSRMRKVEGVRIQSDTITLTSIYDQHDSNLTGVQLAFDCEETQGSCLSRESLWWAWDTAETMHTDDGALVRANEGGREL